MSKVIYCNSLQVSHTREEFALTFIFNAPDGSKETVIVVLAPSGATTLKALLEKDIEEYKKQHGSIAEAWSSQQNNNNSKNKSLLVV